MKSGLPFVRAGVACAALSCAFVADVRDAAACGGCFHPSTEQGSSVITDHRMVLKVSQAETILWDQVQYSGDPTEFAWVLPVRTGAKVELSSDEWMAALDAATKTTVQGPEISCTPTQSTGGSGTGATGSSYPVSSGSGGGGGGCGGGGSASSPSYSDNREGYADASAAPGDHGSDSQFAGNEDVQVVSQEVIGPYQAVTIHSSDGKGIGAWLTDNGFEIPTSVQPIVDAYTQGGFDFIALRLRPGAGVRAMRPVRVVSPGASVTLPLRMVAAGVGSHVGITLWVVGEGRYHTQNFPDAPLVWNDLKWNSAEDRSNLKELTQNALLANGGRSWLTEAAIHTDVVGASTYGANPTLYDAYNQQCMYLPAHTVPCNPSALPPSDGTPDADAGAGDAGDAGADASPPDGGPPQPQCTKVVHGCEGFDDLDVAIRDLHSADVWITRLRADLPVATLSADLSLEATSIQAEMSPQHQTTSFTDTSFDPCASVRNRASPSSSSPPATTASNPPSGGCTCRSAGNDAGTWLLAGVTTLGVAALARRRRRR